MGLASWLVGASLFANLTLFLGLLAVADPSVLAAVASRVVFWQRNPSFALFEFFGIAYTLTGVVAWLVKRGVKGSVSAPMNAFVSERWGRLG